MPRQAGEGGLSIVVNAGPGLQANAQVMAALQSAAETLEEMLLDPVTIVIAADIQDLAPSTLGQASSRTFVPNYGDVRTALIADRSSDEDIIASLPAGLPVETPPGFTFNGRASATKANLRSLEFDMSFDNATPDATIIFNTSFLAQFDLDPSDGIASNKVDFQAIVVHELVHVLGFTSHVDTVDVLLANQKSAEALPTPMDFFRLLPTLGGTDFAGSARILVPGDFRENQVLFDGDKDIPMSTGRFLGDGQQATHWKADEFSGVNLGIMDPTLSNGVHQTLSANDIRVLGLIGWNTSPSVPQPDLAVKPDTGNFVGGNVYNTSASGQGVTVNAKRNQTKKFFMRLENDGDLADVLRIKGTGDTSVFTVKYFDKGTKGKDITAQVKAGTFATGSIEAGKSVTIRAEAKVKSGAGIGKKAALKLTATSVASGTQRDTVSGTIKVIK